MPVAIQSPNRAMIEWLDQGDNVKRTIDLTCEYMQVHDDPYAWLLAPLFGKELDRLGRKRFEAAWGAVVRRHVIEFIRPKVPMMLLKHDEFIDAVRVTHCSGCGGASVTETVVPGELLWALKCSGCGKLLVREVGDE